MCWFRYVRNYVFFNPVILAIRNAPSFWPKKASFSSKTITQSNFGQGVPCYIERRIFSMLARLGERTNFKNHVYSSILIRSPLQYRSVLSFMQHSHWTRPQAVFLGSADLWQSQEKKTTLIANKLLLKSFKYAITPMVLTEWPINSVERWDLLDELLEHGKAME